MKLMRRIGMFQLTTSGLRLWGMIFLLLSGICGGMLLVIADILARSVSAAELPVSIFTSLIGAPFLIVLLVRRRRDI